MTKVSFQTHDREYIDLLPSTPSMKLFHSRRAKRTTASLTLLVWVFALASGVAHACLLDSGEEALQGGGAASAHSSSGHAGAVPHEEYADDPDDKSVVSKASCLRVCDDGSHSLPSHSFGLDLTDSGIPTLVTVLWTPDARDIGTSERLCMTQPPPPGQPARTRFSRLAL